MTSPHHLHATRTAWATRAALGRLAELVQAEARRHVDTALAASTALHSPVYGTRHAIGGHADPVSARLSAPDPSGHTSGWVELSQRATDRLEWIARKFGATPRRTALDAIHDRIPHLLPSTAALLHRHLTDEDAWIRAAVRLEPAGTPLTGVPCPRCDQRQLQVHTDGPEAAWTVTCTCICVGQGCRCEMPGAVEGVQHIWPRAAVLGAAAGAAPAVKEN